MGAACSKSSTQPSNLFLMERLQEGILEAIERLVKRQGQEMYGVSLPFIFQAHKDCRVCLGWKETFARIMRAALMLMEMERAVLHQPAAEIRTPCPEAHR